MWWVSRLALFVLFCANLVSSQDAVADSKVLPSTFRMAYSCEVLFDGSAPLDYTGYFFCSFSGDEPFARSSSNNRITNGVSVTNGVPDECWESGILAGMHNQIQLSVDFAEPKRSDKFIPVHRKGFWYLGRDRDNRVNVGGFKDRDVLVQLNKPSFVGAENSYSYTTGYRESSLISQIDYGCVIKIYRAKSVLISPPTPLPPIVPELNSAQ